MQLSAAQQFALNEMGIPVWVQRQDDVSISAALSGDNDIVSQLDFQKNWLVIADESVTTAEKRLLKAIFASIDVGLGDVLVINPQQATLLAKCSADKTVVLVLGEQWSRKLNVQPHNSLSCQQIGHGLLTLTGPCLRDLLDQPQRKFEMWQVVLKLRNLRAAHLD